MTYTDKKDMAHVVMSANSLRRGNPTTLKVNLEELKIILRSKKAGFSYESIDVLQIFSSVQRTREQG